MKHTESELRSAIGYHDARAKLYRKMDDAPYASRFEWKADSLRRELHAMVIARQGYAERVRA